MVLSIGSRMIRRQFASSPVWRSGSDGILQSPRFLHATSIAQQPRKRQFFSSNAVLQLEAASPAAETLRKEPHAQKRKTARSQAGKRSLRRVAEEAQRSRESATQRQSGTAEAADNNNGITAICVAEEFDMGLVVQVLRSHGFPIDPHGTGFLEEQVVHTRGVNDGDIFVFPSGTIVAWSLPEDVVINLATRTLMPAAINPHVKQMEVEDLEYKEDPNRESSNIKGDMITLGTKIASQENDQLMYVFSLQACGFLHPRDLAGHKCSRIHGPL
jgi:required for meiotic nuclear division protein 1